MADHDDWLKLPTTKYEIPGTCKNRDFHITAMSGHLTQQSMKELESLTVSSFI